ncbi:MAG: flagellar biosynthetic protein FliR [Alphaproteobacteria bacterium]|nr:MAG: flagellar biosynthetic protein FliR [Alphaproteobacteria bacterium]
MNSLLTFDPAQMMGQQVFPSLLLFARLGSMLMVMPGIGQVFVPVRIRLLVALSLVVLMMPPLRGVLPPQPEGLAELTALIVGECLIGIFIGTLARIMLSALDTAGNVIAYQVGLNSAAIFNPAMAGQGSPPAAIIGMAGVLLFMAADLHHMMLRALADSYTTLKPGAALPVGEFSLGLARLVGQTFMLGCELAAPFLILMTVLYVGFGVIARLIPQIQVFFLALPAQVWLGLVMMTVTIPLILVAWLQAFPAGMSVALGGTAP